MSFTRRVFVALTLVAAVASAQALEVKPYSAAALTAAEQANKPVALHFHAPWCPTCRAQAKTLDGLAAEPGLNVTVLVADYDSEKDLKRRFNVRAQSTLIVLHGNQERGRVVGETSADALRTVLKTAL